MNNIFRLSFLALLLVLTGCNKQPALHFHANDVTGQFPLVGFSLTDHTGKPRTLADFRGKVAVLFFGYTHCPDVCPTTLADLAQTMRLLGADAQKVQVLFITVDPERDTKELLAKFVPAFNPSFLGLYGDALTTRAAARSFRADYMKQPLKSGGYSMDHSTFKYIVDPQGKLRLLAGERETSQMMAEDIRQLLASTS